MHLPRTARYPAVRSAKLRSDMETPDTLDPVAELAAAVAVGRKLATQARADLETATPKIHLVHRQTHHHSGPA